MDCDFDNAALSCPRCGFDVGAIDGDKTWRRNCPGRRLLGDWIASALAWLGIHKRPGCGCEKRQSWLNRWHARLRSAVTPQTN